MTTSQTPPRIWAHVGGLLSGALAASICLGLCQLAGLIFFAGHIGQTLLYGLSLSGIAFGATYAAAFFTSIAGRRKEIRNGTVPAM